MDPNSTDDLSLYTVNDLCQAYSIAFNKLDFEKIKNVQKEFARRKMDFWREYEKHVETYNVRRASK